MKLTYCCIILLCLFSGNLLAKQVKLTVGLDTPVVLVNTESKAYLKVGLTGYRLEEKHRTAVNVAIVLDQSGSMTGQKIRKAKEAAKLAVELLQPDDIVSIVAYNDRVQVVVPATKVSEKRNILSRIDELHANGSTALFAGVSKGASELEKFFDKNKVNRVILLSDGLANVGPSSPAELGDLGASLGKQGIAVSTIGLGLGYNEDLMSQLAMRSDGNHAFVENARDLARIFQNEFKDVLSVVAQDVVIEIECLPGIKPIRVLGREAQIMGQKIVTKINQLYSQHEKYVLIEVEIPPSAQKQRRVANVNVDYADMRSGNRENVRGLATVAFTNSPARVKAAVNPRIKASTVEQISASTNNKALQLRDKGRVEEARKLLLDNAAYLRENYKALPGSMQGKFQELEEYNRSAADKLDKQDWARTRKSLRKKEYELKQQQTY